jgi:hypothetical protein
MVTEISAEQATSFALLRRAQVASDRLPEGRSHAFEGGFMGLRGLNPALARRASTALGDLWVVPGNGHIALYDGGATCNPTEAVGRHGMVMWGSSRPHEQIFVQGLVPDGVSCVTLTAADGVSTAATVTENVYAAILAAGLRLGRFDGPTGPIEFGPAAH